MTYLDELLAQHRDELAFVVLFGSTARGNWSCGSDYDVLIGLRGDDDKRLLDRMAEFTPSEALNVDVFPYSRSEWQRMFHDFHPLLLEALDHGIVLWDRGEFATMRATFGEWCQQGRVQPWRSGWKSTPPATPPPA